ncbi:MAG: hypothetical protein ACI4DY_13310 [Monoglobaceae bacterium]
MKKQKTDNTSAPVQSQRKRDYHITVAAGGKVITTLLVSADCVRNSLKEAYIEESGRQGKDPENLGG